MDEAKSAAAGPAGAEWDPALGADVRSLADQLLPVFYTELKRIARRERSRVRGRQTLQTTALVHEAYLKLRGAKGWNDDAHFLRAAALAMRHALVNHAVARKTAKRGGDLPHVPLEDVEEGSRPVDEVLVALNEALLRLAQHAPRQAQVVECRFFGGYDERETAVALNLSERTVRRDWTLARAWLYRELATG